MAEAQLQSVTKKFGDIAAINSISLDIKDGEFVVLLGPTGAGKTTTLRLFAGLEAPDTGTVTINGRNVTDLGPSQRDVAFVFQQYSLYPHYSVYDNMAFPLRAPGRKVPEADIKKRVHEIAEMLRIDSKLKNKSTQLSGGEMQRVSIGRALVREPNLFLMDEPLSSLDAKLREDLRVELKRIQRELGATILYVTHDQLEAMTLADRIGVLSEGVLDQIDEPRKVYEKPSSIYTAMRLGSPQINLLDPNVLQISNVPLNTSKIGVRPEDIVFNGQGVPAKVLTVEHLGVETVALLDVKDTKVHALLGAHTTLAEGDVANISTRPGSYFHFDEHGKLIETSDQKQENINCNANTDNSKLIVTLAEACLVSIIDNEEHIESLDRAIGDGDHYINVTRGLKSIVSKSSELREMKPSDTLKTIARNILSSVGGASGPLLASFFLAMSKTPGIDGQWNPDLVSRMVMDGVSAVQARGKANFGEKTMLDVWIPVSQKFRELADIDADHSTILSTLPSVAESGMLATKDMRAKRGRAAFLGERAIGHIDPGAMSGAIIISTICNFLSREKT